MSANQGAEKLIIVATFHPKRFSLVSHECVVLLKTFQQIYGGAKTAGTLWSPALCFRVTDTDTHMHRGVIISTVCGLLSPMNPIGHADGRREKVSHRPSGLSGRMYE